MLHGLPYAQIWALDFEFVADPGARPIPVCMVARELISNRTIRLWQDELGPEPPFDVGPSSLFVAYYASAEIGCFLELGWPVPARLLDLYTEFRNETNGMTLAAGRGLLGALAYHGITSITAEQKHAERELIMGGGPWTPDERRRILDYCETDVVPMGALLERMLPAILSRPAGFGQALLRGRYMIAVGRMECNGVPIDVEILERFRSNWSRLKLDLIRAIDADFGVYDGAVFKAGLFAAYLDRRKIAWPRTGSGRMALDRDTMKDMAKTYPELEPLRELRNALAELRLEKLAVGPDGRNRVLLSPFGASSGRNTPGSSKFIFGPSVWLRGLIKPEPGRALAYIDYSSQEIYVAAALSGDQALGAAVQSGDPYIYFARMAGLVPADATKASHKAIRDMCKTCLLGANYGMGAAALAARTGMSLIEAGDLLRRLARTFPTFTAWADKMSDLGQLAGSLSTVFGWTVRVADSTRPASLRNFPMQSHGAEILRLACCLATERGIEVCAPVHDALLVEADAADIEDVVARTREAMGEASRDVIGVEIPTDADIVAWPDRYADPRGQVMWDRATKVLDAVGQVGQRGQGGQTG